MRAWTTARTVVVIVWAFRVWAQFDSDPAEDGWVVTATHDACEAGRATFVEAARTYASQVDLSECRSMTPEDVGRLTPEPGRTMYAPTH